jgi:NAD(P)-dependent dehydrogenase (short-subunit alcohol dehydrogenase family)
MVSVDLKNKVVIVTGGGGAIGGAMALQLAANGAKVVVAGRTMETLQNTVDKVKAAGGEAAAVVADVGDKRSAAEMVEKTVTLYGRLDVLVNNAGINGGAEHRKPIHEYDDDLWQRIINVDLNGVYYCSKPAVRQMIAQGNGGASSISAQSWA